MKVLRKIYQVIKTEIKDEIEGFPLLSHAFLGLFKKQTYIRLSHNLNIFAKEIIIQKKMKFLTLLKESENTDIIKKFVFWEASEAFLLTAGFLIVALFVLGWVMVIAFMGAYGAELVWNYLG